MCLVHKSLNMFVESIQFSPVQIIYIRKGIGVFPKVIGNENQLEVTRN